MTTKQLFYDKCMKLQEPVTFTFLSPKAKANFEEEIYGTPSDEQFDTFDAGFSNTPIFS